MNIDELNEKIQNESENLNALKGYEIICESLIYKINDIFGKNMLLSMLYQIGTGPGEMIAKRIKTKYNKEEFELMEAFQILLKELKDFYSIKVRNIEIYGENSVRLTIENRCFLRESIKNRDRMQFGKAFCRVNKGYFEQALKFLVGKKLLDVDIKFLYNDEDKDVCVEQLEFHLLK